MINKDVLINKGFQLNNYPQGSYYEFETRDKSKIADILGDDYCGDEKVVILQSKEDFTDKVVCVDTNVWQLDDGDFVGCLERI